MFRSWALLLAAAPAPPFKSYAGSGAAASKIAQLRNTDSSNRMLYNCLCYAAIPVAVPTYVSAVRKVVSSYGSAPASSSY